MSHILLQRPPRRPRMDEGGAKALAKHLTDTSLNPPRYAKAASNGPHHHGVVHVTFGEPKQQRSTDREGNEKTFTPERPRPYTVGA